MRTLYTNQIRILEYIEGKDFVMPSGEDGAVDIDWELAAAGI